MGKISLCNKKLRSKHSNLFYLQAVSKDMHSTLNCHNVAKYRVLPEIVTAQCGFYWYCRMFEK
jgi:hypothetical protein